MPLSTQRSKILPPLCKTSTTDETGSKNHIKTYLQFEEIPSSAILVHTIRTNTIRCTYSLR